MCEQKTRRYIVLKNRQQYTIWTACSLHLDVRMCVCVHLLYPNIPNSSS
jgi:hypothetical protein